MENTTKIICGILMFVFLSGSSIYDKPLKDRMDLYKQIMNTDEIKNCQKNGGVIQAAGILRMPNCVITYPDAGKPCKNSTKCTHGCFIIDKDIPMGTLTEGECAHNNLPFGCQAPVEQGIVGASMCVD